MNPSKEVLDKRRMIVGMDFAKHLFNSVSENKYCRINADILSRHKDKFWEAVYYSDKRSNTIKSLGCNEYYGMFVRDCDDEDGRITIVYEGKYFSFYPKNIDELMLVCNYIYKFYDKIDVNELIKL